MTHKLGSAGGCDGESLDGGGERAKSLAARLAAIHNPIWITHPHVTPILDRLDYVYTHPKTHRMPNVLVVGPTGSGKTLVIQRWITRTLAASKPSNYAIGTNNCGDVVPAIPVVYTQVPCVPDEGRLYRHILAGLGAHAIAVTRSRVGDLEMSALRGLRNAGTRVLVLDEIQDVLCGSTQNQRRLLSAIKHLGNSLQIPIVACGTEEAFIALRTDRALANRFWPMRLMRWKNDDAFRKLLATFEDTLGLTHVSNLATPGMSSRILGMTDGTIGEIAQLLKVAAVAAIRSGLERIDDTVLDSLNWISPSDRGWDGHAA